MGIPMLKIRRSQDCFIFDMGTPILVRWHLYIIETAPDAHKTVIVAVSYMTVG